MDYVQTGYWVSGYAVGDAPATSPPQADLSASFTVRSSLRSDALSAFDVRGSVSSYLSASYDIQNASSATSSLGATYVVRGAVQSGLTAAYALRASVGQSGANSFMVRGLVLSDLSVAYGVQPAQLPVHSDLMAIYAIDGIAPTFTRSVYWAAVPSEKFSAAVPGGNQ